MVNFIRKWNEWMLYAFNHENTGKNSKAHDTAPSIANRLKLIFHHQFIGILTIFRARNPTKFTRVCSWCVNASLSNAVYDIVNVAELSCTMLLLLSFFSTTDCNRIKSLLELYRCHLRFLQFFPFILIVYRIESKPNFKKKNQQNFINNRVHRNLFPSSFESLFVKGMLNTALSDFGM